MTIIGIIYVPSQIKLYIQFICMTVFSYFIVPS